LDWTLAKEITHHRLLHRSPRTAGGRRVRHL